ncbi:MAG: glutathione peroxidase [Bacteroidetes bacterium]|nr:glutathione peroxidase [Bacteroidota bacterium]
MKLTGKKTLKYLLVLFITTTTLMKALAQENKNFHDFTVETIDGKQIALSEFKGKKILVVNTASKCGFTPQYAELQKLYEEYGGDKFTIIGFPANNFLKQEPGSNEEIKTFCEINYGVTFPMMAKISVKGKDINPLYSWLTNKELNGVMDAEVKWNFQKFMIDENGNLLDVIPPRESPYTDKIVTWLSN